MIHGCRLGQYSIGPDSQRPHGYNKRAIRLTSKMLKRVLDLLQEASQVGTAWPAGRLASRLCLVPSTERFKKRLNRPCALVGHVGRRVRRIRLPEHLERGGDLAPLIRSRQRPGRIGRALVIDGAVDRDDESCAEDPAIDEPVNKKWSAGLEVIRQVRTHVGRYCGHAIMYRWEAMIVRALSSAADRL